MGGDRWSLGIDIGGTKILIAHVAEDGKVLREKNIPTNVQNGSNGIIQDLLAQAKLFCSESPDSLLQSE